MNLCGACAPPDLEHDCCINILKPGACPCRCKIILDPPSTIPAFFVFMNHPPAPAPVQLVLKEPTDQDPPPIPQRFYCRRDHLVAGDNAYYDSNTRRWQCRTCRRASWRKSGRRRALQARGETA